MAANQIAWLSMSVKYNYFINSNTSSVPGFSWLECTLHILLFLIILVTIDDVRKQNLPLCMELQHSELILFHVVIVTVTFLSSIVTFSNTPLLWYYTLSEIIMKHSVQIYVIYYIHFENVGDPCNLIGSQQYDLFPNCSIFALTCIFFPAN